jgi:hypothetical protein
MELNNELPKILKPDGAGARLWTWLHVQTDNVADNMPLVTELCIIADRLDEVRTKLASQGISVSGPHGRSTKNPLMDSEIKLSKQFQALYKGLGLSDREDGQGRLL